MKGYTPPDSEKLAVYHILQLAEQGRFEEIVAQMIASVIVASDGGGDEAYDLRTTIMKRVLDLMLDPSEIWEGLLPGGTGSIELFTTMQVEYADKLMQRERNVEEIVSIVGQPEEAWLRMSNLDKYFTDEGLVTPRSKPTQATQWDYRVSIIVAPGIRHDEPGDLLIFNQVFHVESVLNLAADVIRLMEKRANGFPEEEQAAWITKAPDEHWIMTWDQAQAILLFEQMQEKLEAIEYQGGISWYDEFQGIQDMMAIAGAEYRPPPLH